MLKPPSEREEAKVRFKVPRRPSNMVWPWWWVSIAVLVYLPDGIAFIRFGTKPSLSIVWVLIAELLVMAVVWACAAILSIKYRKALRLKESLARIVSKTEVGRIYHTSEKCYVIGSSVSVFRQLYVITYDMIPEEERSASDAAVAVRLTYLRGRFDVPRTTTVVQGAKLKYGYPDLDLGRILKAARSRRTTVTPVEELSEYVGVFSRLPS